jgi:general secretion pathway protein A
MIARASGGIPRTINILCDTALVYGFATGVDLITTALVSEVLEQKKTFRIFGR